ncbi:MAG: signal peptidase I, partial [archaeon]
PGTGSTRNQTMTSKYDWRRVLRVGGFLLLVAIVALFVAVAFPAAVGADHSYVVKSSSMSPSIGAGSVVFVGEVSTEDIEKGDVITFERSAQSPPERVTHRVVEVVEQDGDRTFRTKGDANENQDQELVSADQFVGRVQFHVPLIGYGVAFAGSQLGIVALVIVPALLLIVTEVWDLYRAADTDSK